MASPWKLLARLVSPRRRQRQEHGSTDDVKPDLLAIANLTETAGDIRLNTAAPPVDENPVDDEQSEAVSADPDHSDETASSIHGTADSENARPAEAADSALFGEPGTLAGEAPKPSQTGEGVTRKRRKLTKSAEPVEAVLPPSAAAPDDTISLDEEIKVLRSQLAQKLRLQNAQLRRMLQRFER
jgi:hypothetical protein